MGVASAMLNFLCLIKFSVNLYYLNDRFYSITFYFLVYLLRFLHATD